MGSIFQNVTFFVKRFRFVSFLLHLHIHTCTDEEDCRQRRMKDNFIVGNGDDDGQIKYALSRHAYNYHHIHPLL